MALHLQDIAIKEGVCYDQDGLHLIAQKADGGLRDALSMFDQIVSFSNKNVNYKAVIDNLNILDYDYYFKLTEAILLEDVPGCLLIFDEILANGFDGNHFITGLASHFRNLLVTKDISTLKLLEVSEGIKLKYQAQSQASSASFLISSLNITNQCDLNYKTSKNQRLQVELTLIKLCHIPSVLNLSNSEPAAFRSDEVKKKLKSADKESNSIKEYALPLIAPIISLHQPEPLHEVHIQATPDLDPEPAVILPLQAEPEQKKLKISIPKTLGTANNSLIPNLKDMEANYYKKEEGKPEYLSGEIITEFDSESMLKYWNEYAKDMKKDGKINIFTIMTANPPALLENYIIEMPIENKIQENLLVDEKVELLNFLRTKLENFGIEIITKQIESTSKKRLYTSTEKYNHMIEKNPKLEEFRRRFNLDIDY
jgi:DNA polymerase-3 subunit gamma/tau